MSAAVIPFVVKKYMIEYQYSSFFHWATQIRAGGSDKNIRTDRDRSKRKESVKERNIRRKSGWRPAKVFIPGRDQMRSR